MASCHKVSMTHTVQSYNPRGVRYFLYQRTLTYPHLLLGLNTPVHQPLALINFLTLSSCNVIREFFEYPDPLRITLEIYRKAFVRAMPIFDDNRFNYLSTRGDRQELHTKIRRILNFTSFFKRPNISIRIVLTSWHFGHKKYMISSFL